MLFLRKRRVFCFAIILVWVLSYQRPMRAQTGPAIWVAPSLQRVARTGSPGTTSLAQIRAARGEWESFQIVIQAPPGGLTNVSVDLSDLQGPGGQVIPQSSFSLYREHYVFVSSSSPDWRGSNRPLGSGWYPDALIPFRDPSTGLPPVGATLTAVPFNLLEGQNQPIWVDLLVPRNAEQGQYSGTYTVTSNEGRFDGGIALTVWNFTMPLKPTLKTSFQFWTAGDFSGNSELLRNRLSPTTTARLDQRALIDGYGLNAANVRFWSGADIGNCAMSPAPTIAQFLASVTLNQPDLYLYDYSADEIGRCTSLYPTIKQWASNMHQAGLRNLITMAPVSELFDDGSGSGRSAVDIWVMLPAMYDRSVSLVRQALEKGDEAWSYNTLVQDSYSPKWEMDFDPINFRIQPGFISQSLNMTGLLYWRVDRWSSDPWNQVNNAGTFSSANFPGEGMLVYPGLQVGIRGVAPSMRLKWLRDGVDDYDYVEILKQLGGEEVALQLARNVGSDWMNWTRDREALESTRRQLAEAIEGRMLPAAPSAPTNPSPADGATDVSLTPTLSWASSSGAVNYDVYLGTVTPPSFAGTTTSTSYVPERPLTAGATYYWRVVANGPGGGTSSPVWSFGIPEPVNSSPIAISVSPNVGIGWRQTFTFNYYDADGFSDLNSVEVLFNSGPDFPDGCWLRYDVKTGMLNLADNTASSWLSLPIGTEGTLQNSQCTVYGLTASAVGVGNTLTLSVGIDFRRRFSGMKAVFMQASDQAGDSSGYSALGTWTVYRIRN